ncbi:MAG: ABC transporter substrate-binding protein [Methylocystaceae bacterium]
MTKNKKVALVVLMIFLVGIVAGCGGSKTGDTSKAGDDTIKVGVIFELSGALASYGTSDKNGVMLAIDEINAAGGINGKKVEPIVVDTKSDPAEATNVAAKLVDQKVVVIFGPATSGATKAIAPIATRANIPVISPSATADDVTVANGKVREFMFRTCFIDSFQGLLAANFAYQELGIKNAAIMTDNSNDYSKGLAKSFEVQFKKLGGSIVANEGYVKGDRDFSPTLTKIKSKNPGFIYNPGYYEEVAPAVKQARELGITVPIAGGDGWGAPQLLETAGKDALNNTFFTSGYFAQDQDPAVVKFNADYKKKFNVEPDQFAALGYDVAKLWADAVNRAGDAEGVKVAKALAETKGFVGVTGKMTIDANHNMSKTGLILEYKDGVQTLKTKIQPQ